MNIYRKALISHALTFIDISFIDQCTKKIIITEKPKEHHINFYRY